MNVHVATPDAAARPASRPGEPIRRALAALTHCNPMVVLAVIVVAALLLFSAAPGWIAPFTPTDMNFDAVLQAPNAAHPFGTDHFGRDVFSLVVYGARQSLMVGLGVVAIGATIGSTAGLLLGYFGRGLDAAFMRLLEIWLALPDILMIIIIATALKPGLSNLIITIGVVSIPRYMRIMRAQAMTIKSRPFVEAARSIGASHAAILIKHIVPHSFSLLLVLATLGVGTAMLTGAALSFIGLGVLEDRPDWGALLSDGRNYLGAAWWFATFPGLAITLVVISLNFLGETLRVRLDPRSQRR